MEAVTAPLAGYDVFCCHHAADKPTVERIARRLRQAGLQPWLDIWYLTPGETWQPELTRALRASRSCAVFVGPQGLGPWAREELAVAQDRAAKDRVFRLFLVLLPGAPNPEDPNLDFLRTRTWVDLRDGPAQPDAFQDLLGAITGTPRRPPPVTVDDDVCPYRGLESFDEEHAEFFFGREEDTARALERLRDGRFLGVVGPSGSGKSSLLRAGIVPALRDGALPSSDTWQIRTLTPGGRPLSSLAAALVDLGGDGAMGRTLNELRDDERTVDLAGALALSGHASGDRLVLAIDQFEELFTLCDDEVERRAFVGNLTYASTIPGGRVAVLVALRADFYHHAARYPGLAAGLATRQFLVTPLSPEGLRRVIEEPAYRVGLELESGLTETMVAEVWDRAGTLPLLEHVLLELWRRRRGRMLTLEGYVAAGRVEGALSRRANATYEAMSPSQQALARTILLRLVQPGQGTEDTKRRASMEELLTVSSDASDMSAVVAALADERLVATSTDEVTGAATVELTHEALIRGWSQLRSWISEERDHLRAVRRLSEAAQEWQEAGRDDALLWPGARLAAWPDTPVADLNQLERAFLAASRARESAERAARRRRVRLALTGLSTALVLISALAVLAFVQSRRALRSRNDAVSRQLASSAERELAMDPELGLLLALRAVRVRHTEDADRVLRQATSESRVRATLAPHQHTVWGTGFSPDGRDVVTAGEDGTVRVWAWRSRRAPLVLRGHRRRVFGAAFSRDGRRVVSAGSDGTVRVWDWRRRTPLALVRTRQGAVRAARFSPDGRRVVTGGEDGTVRIWDWARRRPLRVLRGHRGRVAAVAFSPDGRRLASAGADGTVRVWDWARSVPSRLLRGTKGEVNTVEFAPDGQRVVSAGGDGSIRIWTLADGGRAVVLHQKRQVLGAAFSPDGRRVVSAGGDATVRVWDLGPPAQAEVLRGHRGNVGSVAFSPDGRWVVSAGDDGTVRVWEPTAGALRVQPGQIFGAGYSSDGRLVATAGADGTARIWNWRGRRRLAVLGGTSPLTHAAFSRDGARLVTAGLDGTVRIWDWRSRRVLAQLRGHRGPVYSASFSPDGGRVVTASADGTVRVWRLSAPRAPLVLRGHRADVYSAAFSPDGARVVSAGDDGTVRVWDVVHSRRRPVVLRTGEVPVATAAFGHDGERVVTSGSDGTVRVWAWTRADRARSLRGHDGGVLDAQFSADEKLVVSAGDDGTVRVWNATSGAAVVVFRSMSDHVRSAAFTPDRRSVLSAGEDGTLRVWRCEVCGSADAVVRLARERATRRLSREEQSTFHVPG